MAEQSNKHYIKDPISNNAKKPYNIGDWILHPLALSLTLPVVPVLLMVCIILCCRHSQTEIETKVASFRALLLRQVTSINNNSSENTQSDNNASPEDEEDGKKENGWEMIIFLLMLPIAKMKLLKCYDKYKVLFTISIVLVSTEFIHLKVIKALLVLSLYFSTKCPSEKGDFQNCKALW